MTVPAITETLLAAKKASGLSFADLEAKIGCDEVWIASVFYRQASASVEEATKIIEAIGADSSLIEPLTECPVKGGLDPVVPTDPPNLPLLRNHASLRDAHQSRCP